MIAKIAGIESTAKTRSVVSTMISASASGVSIQVPGRRPADRGVVERGRSRRLRLARGGEPARTMKCSPWKRSVTGKKRRVSRTTQVELGSVVSSDQQHLDGGHDQEDAEHVRIQENSAIRRAPTAIITPRITSAPRMPQNSTRCW